MATKAQNSKTHHVFVYGTLLTGERNAHWAKGALREPATALGTLYDPHYGFPAFSPLGTTIVHGEMLTVDDEGLASMDTLEGCPRLYRRERIEISIASGHAIAYVYIMNRLPKNATAIASGDWVAYRKAGMK